MKPKTKIQVEVWRLHQRLNDPVEHEPFVISNHGSYYTQHYKNLVCLECNHQWKPEQIWQEQVIGVKCPSCNKKLKKIEYRYGFAQRIISYQVVEVVDRFQVYRYFSCWKTMKKDKKPSYHFRSLFEEWVDYSGPKVKKVIVGRIPTWTGDGFTSAAYEIRANTFCAWKSSEYNRFVSDISCPGGKFIPRFDKYKLGDNFHNCDYRFLIEKLESQPRIETLLKARQKELLFYSVHKDDRYYRFWQQIKMVIRHKYKIKDAGLWYDYIELLQEFGKYILNPKFVLPKNLKKAHDEYVRKKHIKMEKIRAKQELQRQEEERMKAEAEEALKNIKAEVFKDFKIKQGKIVIVPLIEEEDVKKEGEILDHCVYAREYHKKSGILLMSARIDGKPIETMEISLANYSIIQSRGYDNKPTEFHDEIISIFRRNIKKINDIIQKAKDLQAADQNLSNLQNVA